MNNSRIYTISELTKEFGVSLRTLRFYESRGLVTPLRDRSTRLYSESDRERVGYILMLRKLGFTVSEIQNGKITYEVFAQQLSFLQDQRSQIDEAITIIKSYLNTMQFPNANRPETYKYYKLNGSRV